MKKILIFLEKNKLSPRGGPYGVGYYLYEEIKRRKIEFIDFLPPQHETDHKKGLLYDLKSFFSVFLCHKKEPVPFSDYSIIHFHTARDLFLYRRALKKYKGKVILTSHSPEPPAREMMNRLDNRVPKIFKKFLYKRFVKIDTFSFKRADYIFFPCEEAEETYKKNWNSFNDIKLSKIDKFRYVLTGIDTCLPKRNKTEVLKELKIDRDDFIICFAGRHNQVKGYDVLKAIGAKVLPRHSNVKILVAGKEEPLKRLDNPNWIEIGYTTDVYSYINACDLYILPNKETYFDLVMLEALSLGKPVLASRTGGNRYFEKEDAKGIFLYNSIDEAENAIELLLTKNKSYLSRLGDANKAFFLAHCSSKKMLDEYLDRVQKII